MAKHFSPNHKSVSRHSVKIRVMPTLKNKRKKKKVQKKVQIPQEDEYEQPARVPITLAEFFSSESEVEEEIIQCNMVSVEEYEVDAEVDEINSAPVQASHLLIKHKKMRKLIPLKSRRNQRRKRLRSPCRKKMLQGNFYRPLQKQRTLGPILCIPAPLSVYDTLQMLRELTEALVMVLMSPDSYKSCFKSADVHTTESSKFCTSCLAAITFGEDDFLLESKSHNRPLYVTGEVGGTTINRILLDCGSAVNLISLKTLHAIGMSVDSYLSLC
ncbi:hypothetical protein L3X38_042889 [Prunus dulcis]|uniref:Uncharacterized protein n=1 Tax=Prunus dulcis TaxID=3755 RepID=A0AAD4UW09_PRUDU|nr:hypothetical protein L3X38_042889 [Prunus dulcis]